MPQFPFNSLKLFCQSAAGLLVIMDDAFCKLAEHGNSHGDVKPVENVLAARADPFGKRPNLLAAVRQEGDVLIGLNSLAFQHIDKASLRLPVEAMDKAEIARGAVLGHGASNDDLEVALPLGPIADIAAIKARAEHLFVLEQAVSLYDVYQQKVAACDIRIESVMKALNSVRGRQGEIKKGRAASAKPHRHRTANEPGFDVGGSLHTLLGKDLTRIDGVGPYLALKLVSECGDDLSAWPSAKHFTSWLSLAPNNKISGGKVLSSRTKRSGSRVASLLRLAAVSVGRTETALGAFYRRLSSRVGKAKAITATARKIAVLFYNAMRHGMDYVDPGASYYETRYRERVVKTLHRRAKALGFVMLAADAPAAVPAVS